MTVRGLEGFWTAGRRLVRRVTPRALILLYHRVAELPSDPFGLCVRPSFFAEHMEVLRRAARPLELRELATAVARGRVPRRAVVVTFDDGYADNLHEARPLFERHEVPVTIFVASGYIGGEREFWWDELERLLLQPGTLTESVRVSVDVRTHRWEMGAVRRYDETSYRQFCGWRVGLEGYPTPRHRVFCELYPMLRTLAESDRQRVLGELRASTSVEPRARPTHRPLSREELRRLADGKLVEIGVHTVTHSALAALSGAAQRAEIRRAKADLEELLERQMTAFAYPYGSRSDYTAETIEIVREAGFAYACASHAAAVSRRSDPLALPRVVVSDGDGEQFEQGLDTWFRG